MHQQLSDGSAKKLLTEIRDVFLEKEIFFSLHRHIVFVCGGTKTNTFRHRFLSYVKKHKPKLRTFLAEQAVKSLLSHSKAEFINLAQFEDLIASIFDSILIFPESPGSIAELGFFANSGKLQNKILVANDSTLQGDSFINLGPVAIIDATSAFRPTIYLDKENPDFEKVVKQLLRYDEERIQRDRFEYNKYKNLGIRERFAVVLEFIGIFRGLNFTGLQKCIKTVFGNHDDKEIQRFLSILQAAGFIQRLGSNYEYFSLVPGASTLLDIEHYSVDTLRARATEYFRKHDKKTYDVVWGAK
ncbi:MAG TPA: hypothetical protein ENJ35_09335 [Gammaproteobacteria bacterium]|nr:hypothetical protein [Gammaproteobacteria bacterium]